MLFRPTIGTDLSGSLGGIVASHNKGGPYFRNRSIPTNPSTSFQQTLRNAMTVLTTAWNDDLTVVERDAWQTYADNVPLTNRIGESRNVSGQNMYVRGNIVALQTGFPRQDTAPTVFNLGSFTEPILVSADATAQTAEVSFTNTDAWANEDDSAMLVYLSRPQNPSINFFKGPYQFAGSIDGDAITPPVSPSTINSPFLISDGQTLFMQIRVCRADGRLSGKFRDNTVVTVP